MPIDNYPQLGAQPTGPQYGMQNQTAAPALASQNAAMQGQGIQPTGPQMGKPQQGLAGYQGMRGGMAASPVGPQAQNQAQVPQSTSGLMGQMPSYASAPGPQYGHVNPGPNQAPWGPQPGTSWNQGGGQGGPGGFSGPFYGQMPQQAPQQPQQSVEQSVQTGSPQSVQNFLSALNKVGAGSNNTFQNQPGQQGAGPQAGFQGFQQNGQQAMPGNNVAYGGPMQSQLGFANNYASQGGYGYGQAPWASGGQVAQGGTGGAFGQQMPQYQATSDVSAKTDIAPGHQEIQDFLNSLGVYSYEYKDKANGEGRRISPMAQEIESTPLGKAAVSPGPDGMKRVDYAKLAGTQLAGLAFLNHKVDKIMTDIAANVSTRAAARKAGK